MPKKSGDRGISRRELFKIAGATGAGIALGGVGAGVATGDTDATRVGCGACPVAL